MEPSSNARLSPLVLVDRLISLAKDADRAGLRKAAEILLHTAERMCDEPPKPH